ncbi:MAG TPA: hypothetical protein VJH05_00295 [Candidatus Paceibacterota bacterium]
MNIRRFSIFKLFLICGLIFLVYILYFDFWVYKSFVLGIEENSRKNDTKQLFLLKTPLLEKATEEITKKDEFISNPKYPLIKDPF